MGAQAGQLTTHATCARDNSKANSGGLTKGPSLLALTLIKLCRTGGLNFFLLFFVAWVNG
jgi:hypothetical protein